MEDALRKKGHTRQPCVMHFSLARIAKCAKSSHSMTAHSSCSLREALFQARYRHSGEPVRSPVRRGGMPRIILLPCRPLPVGFHSGNSLPAARTHPLAHKNEYHGQEPGHEGREHYNQRPLRPGLFIRRLG